MREIIEEAIESALKKNRGSKLYKLEFKGQGASFNEIYSAGNWRVRHTMKKKFRAIFEDIIDRGGLEWMNKFSLWIFYNSRHDPCNVGAMEKVFVDSLRTDKNSGRIGYVSDDSKKYFRGFGIWPDETLEKNTFQFYILRHE